MYNVIFRDITSQCGDEIFVQFYIAKHLEFVERLLLPREMLHLAAISEDDDGFSWTEEITGYVDHAGTTAQRQYHSILMGMLRICTSSEKPP